MIQGGHGLIDGHWTPEGNRLAAMIVERDLRRLSLLPPLAK
jgi:hypothetical protein